MGRRRADDEGNRRIELDEEVRRRVEEGRWGGGEEKRTRVGED